MIATRHGLDPAWVLPGNGAAELFTWAARDAAAAGRERAAPAGLRRLPAGPGLLGRCLASPAPAAAVQHCARSACRQPFPAPPAAEVLWITNPHNPTGQLWSRASLEPLLQRFALVIVDEAFLPLVPAGEAQSLIPLVAA